MQANEELAKRLAELTQKAKDQREQLHEDLGSLKKPKGLSTGVSVLKTAHALGMDDPKLIMSLAKTVFVPAGLAIARLLLRNSSPKRFLGAALIAAGSLGIYKGIEYDERRKLKKAEEEANETEGLIYEEDNLPELK